MTAIPFQLGGLFPLHGGFAAGLGPLRRGGAEARRIISQPDAEARPVVNCAMDQRSDESLLEAYLKGERSAFPKLMTRYADELLHFLTRFLGSRAAADDVFQETFLQVHLSAETFDMDRRFKPWLFTIAANKARDYHRKHGRRSPMSLSAEIDSAGEGERFVDLLESGVAQPNEPLLDAERSRLVKRVVDSLPSHLREILLLSYFQGFSYNQIAESLEIPLGTVKSRLHTAVASFARAWDTARDAGGTEGQRNIHQEKDLAPDRRRRDGRTP